jgi:hypothetical protein
MNKSKSKGTRHTAPSPHRRRGRALVAVLATFATVTGAAQALAPARASAEMDLGNGCVMQDWPIIVCKDPDGGGTDVGTAPGTPSASTPVVVDVGTPGPGATDPPVSTDGDQIVEPVNPDEIEVFRAEDWMRSRSCSMLQQRIARMPHTHNGRPSDLPDGLRDELYHRFKSEGCGRR